MNHQTQLVSHRHPDRLCWQPPSLVSVLVLEKRGKIGQWQVVFYGIQWGQGYLRIATDITHTINVWVVVTVDLPTLG